MYQYNVVNSENLSLHDCRANRMSWEDGILSFFIPDGIWIVEKGEAIKTNSSRVDFEVMDKNVDDVDIYLFRKTRSGKVIREQWKVDNFINAVNEGTFEVEFLYKYLGYQYILYKCCVWFKKAPYCYECEIEMHSTKMVCRYN